MRIFALELNNDIKGIAQRKGYIEKLIEELPSPELVVLPELALCGYMASQKAWQYADDQGRKTAEWAVETARRYGTCIAAGYVDKENGDYYNRYMIAGVDGVYGFVSKSEGESAVFRRGNFTSVIATPFGNVGVGICFDSRRRHFYENVKDETLSLILFPHGSPADPKKPEKERRENDARCLKYVDAFGIPVVYVNSRGSLEYMPGKMGALMKRHGFRMNGMSRIYAPAAVPIPVEIPEAIAADVRLVPKRRVKDIRFHGDDILPGNWLFRHLILRPDTKAGIRSYEAKHSLPVRDGTSH